MPRPKSDRPAYCKHKRTGRAFVTIDGRQRTLPGAYGSAESRAEYDRIVGTWLANGRTLPAAPAASTGPTVSVVAIAFWKHAQAFYVGTDGKPTGEAINFRYALRPLRRLYGATPAIEFGPKKLKALRAAMLLPQPIIDPGTKAPKLDDTGKPITRPGWARSYANRQTDRLKRVFKWAAGEELIPAAVSAAIDTVEGLRRGRDGARETAPVKPADGALVDAVLKQVSAQVEAMIRLQLLTGMRPGEVVMIRGVDLDTTGDVWTYAPPKHKTEAHGHARKIYLGPKAQEVIQPFLKPDMTAYLFSPADAERARREAASEARTTPAGTGNGPGTNRKARPSRKPGDRYTVLSYYRAIERACDKAFPAPPETSAVDLVTWRKSHRWHPHQLRHNAGTVYRREGDFEAAKIVLGHRTDSVTQLYAERDERKAKEIVARIG